MAVESVHIYCPYCGENIEVLIDCSELFQEYIEDCQVCCRPISLSVAIGDNQKPVVEAKSENE